MNSESSHPHVLPPINGSDYFNNRDPKEYDVEKYVIFRGDLSLTGPGLVAKHWNNARTLLLKSSSRPHAKWAEGAKNLSKAQVQKLTKKLSMVPAKDSLNANGPSGSDAPSGIALAAVVSGSNAPSGVAPAPTSVSAPPGVAPALVPAPSSVAPAPAPALVSAPSNISPATIYRDDSSVSSQSISVPSLTSTSTTSCDLPKSSREAMKADYVANFGSYNGEGWVLSSGLRFDDRIYLSTLDKKNESSLHSFVLDSRELPRYLKLFDDREVLDVKKRLEVMKHKDDSELPKWQMDIFNYYGSVSAIEMASRKGFQNMITFKGEGGEPAGFQEFNELIYDFMHASGAEIGAIEGGKKDEGSYGTKCLVDSVKMAKVLKDMFDFVCTRAGGNGIEIVPVKKQLEVYGFLVSKLRVEFVSFKYLGGRHFYFNREVEHFIPDLLTDQAVSKICLLATQFLLWRSRIETTAEDVGKLINGCGTLRSQKYESLPTLTTPPSSPRLKKKKLVNSE
ncbi:hypothetical protein BGX26_005842 [Mortierella sp. AD094]|nr:hypothetical protein BGX26_005842 [Mortierella sp. AD094]